MLKTNKLFEFECIYIYTANRKEDTHALCFAQVYIL